MKLYQIHFTFGPYADDSLYYAGKDHPRLFSSETEAIEFAEGYVNYDDHDISYCDRPEDYNIIEHEVSVNMIMVTGNEDFPEEKFAFSSMEHMEVSLDSMALYIVEKDKDMPEPPKHLYAHVDYKSSSINFVDDDNVIYETWTFKEYKL